MLICDSLSYLIRNLTNTVLVLSHPSLQVDVEGAAWQNVFSPIQRKCVFLQNVKCIIMKRILMITMFAAMAVGCGGAQNKVTSINSVDVDEFAMIIAQKNVRLIDVRTPKEFAEGHIMGAEMIDVKIADFAERIKDITDTVAVYCRSGKRSLMAAEQLIKQGCTVYNLDGGILAWQKAGKPTTNE